MPSVGRCEDVVAGGFEPIEDPRAAEPRQRAAPSAAVRDAVADGAAGGEERARPLRPSPPAPRATAGVMRAGARDPSSRAPGAIAQIRRGHVEPAVAPVALEILPEIGRAAAPCRPRPTRASSAGVVVAGDAQHEPADRVGRAAAVVQHVVPGLVARRASRPAGTRSADRGTATTGRRQSRIVVRQRDEDQRRRRRPAAGSPPTARVEPCAPVVERRRRSACGHAGLVGEVVGRPRERVDGGDVRPHARGQQPRRDRESSRSASRASRSQCA